MRCQYQYFVVLKRLVAAGYHLFARLQSLQHLVVLRVLPAYANVAAIGFLSALVEHEDPLAARGLEEGAARNDDGLLGLAQLQVDVVGLACADVLRALTPEDEVSAELALAHLRIDLAHQ